MIITLIVIAVIITGIVCLTIGGNNWRCPDLVWETGAILTASGIIVSLFVFGFIISANVNKDIDYQNAMYEREMLEYRIDNMEENIVGNEMLYNDIVEFNNELRNVKKWANNPWTNWFYNKDVATIDYIELNGN